MSHRNGTISLAVLSLAALGFVALPVGARAQGPGTSGSETVPDDQLNKPIDLDVKSASLYYALQLMFEQLKVGNYTLPDALKNVEVSAHFTKLPIRTALETLLKNSGYTYKVDGGVYSVVPRIEETAPTPIPQDLTNTEAPVKGKKIYRITGNQIIYNSVDIVTRLGGRVLPSSVGSTSTATGVSGLGGNSFGGLGGGLGGLGGGLGGFGGGLGGGLGGFGGGLGGFGGGGLGGFGGGGFSGGGGLVGGGGYFGGGNNFGGGNRGGRGF